MKALRHVAWVQIPGLTPVCGMSLLLVLVPVLTVFTRLPVFPPSITTNISKFQFDLETVDEEPPCGYTTTNSHFILFYLPEPSHARNQLSSLLLIHDIERPRATLLDSPTNDAMHDNKRELNKRHLHTLGDTTHKCW